MGGASRFGHGGFLRQRAYEQNRPHIISLNKGDGPGSGTVTLEKAHPSSTDRCNLTKTRSLFHATLLLTLGHTLGRWVSLFG